MTHVVQPHPLSEAARAIEAACAQHVELTRKGIQLWRSHASQELRDANRAEKEAARIEWRRLVGEFEGRL